jgi:hypothetical protein
VKTQKRYPFVQSFIDQYGKVRHYYRRRGYSRIALPDINGPEFASAYAAAVSEPRAVPLSARRGAVERGSAQPLIGVYLLLRNGRIVYVGSSLDMPKRVAAHRSNGRPFDKAFYIATTAKERVALERVLIRIIDPAQNCMGRIEQSENTSVSNGTPSLTQR